MFFPRLFLSYSHQNRDFAKKLSSDLAVNKVLVWWDQWEIKVGDSIISKIEKGIQTSGYLGIILSKASVKSSWVKEELNAGLIRQLRERKVFVLPIYLETCEIPVFLQDKKYADFRENYDQGLKELLSSIEPPNLDYSGRTDTGDYHNDYTFEWGKVDGNHFCKIIITSHSDNLPFSISAQVLLIVNDVFNKRIVEYESAGFHWFANLMIFEHIQTLFTSVDPIISITGDQEVNQKYEVGDPERGHSVFVFVKARRLGPDPGNDLIYEWKTIFEYAAAEHRKGIENALLPKDKNLFAEWLIQNRVN